VQEWAVELGCLVALKEEELADHRLEVVVLMGIWI
jgi:hypothetical protein